MSYRLVFQRQHADRGVPVFEEKVETVERAAAVICFIFAAFAQSSEHVTVSLFATSTGKILPAVWGEVKLGRDDGDLVRIKELVVSELGSLSPNVSIEGAP